jgi:hypothetical protein
MGSDREKHWHGHMGVNAERPKTDMQQRSQAAGWGCCTFHGRGHRHDGSQTLGHCHAQMRGSTGCHGMRQKSWKKEEPVGTAFHVPHRELIWAAVNLRKKGIHASQPGPTMAWPWPNPCGPRLSWPRPRATLAWPNPRGLGNVGWPWPRLAHGQCISKTRVT